MGRKFHILDVFTDKAYSGNQLAVVEDADGLTVEQMQEITREFGFSETVFLQSSENPTAIAKARIFTPMSEIPFAGHPTIGTAILLGEQKAKMNGGAQDVLLVLDEEIGPVRCVVSIASDKASYAEFDVPQLPKAVDDVPEVDLVADALGLDIQDVGFENHKLTSAEIGIQFIYVPLKNITLVRKAAPDYSYWKQAFSEFGPVGLYVYCRDGVSADSGFHARMFAPDFGVPEDSATGSAVVGFAKLIEKFEIDAQTQYETVIEQGIEMGRPSLIKLEVEFQAKAMKLVRIGGQAVQIASGELF